MEIPLELLNDIIGIMCEENLFNWNVTTHEDYLEFYIYDSEFGCLFERTKRAANEISSYLSSDQCTFKYIASKMKIRFDHCILSHQEYHYFSIKLEKN